MEGVTDAQARQLASDLEFKGDALEKVSIASCVCTASFKDPLPITLSSYDVHMITPYQIVAHFFPYRIIGIKC